MTRFGTATGKGNYSLSFETDNHEHFEYMQRAARFCVDGHFFGANLNFQRLQEELTRAKADAKRFADINDSLIEENEAFQKETERLKAELEEERNNHDRLQDFEVAESEELREAKLYLRILLEYLGESGYDVEKLEKIVALKRVLMKLEENNE